MPSFTSDYKAEYVALVNEVESKMKKVIVDDITRGIPFSYTQNTLDELIKEFEANIPEEYIERANMVKALQFSKKVFYNDYMNNIHKPFLKAKKEIEKVLGIRIDTPMELLGAMMMNLKKLDIKQVYDVTEGSTMSFTKGTPYIADYYQQVTKAVNEMVEQSIIEPISPKAKRGGENALSLRSLVEMSIRQDFHANQMENYKQEQVELVAISTHADCSERCQPYQGKVFSLNKKYGTINGQQYEPIENATEIFVKTKNGRTWKNGLFGFNCRHRMIKYVEGELPPMDYSKDEIAKERDISNKQRGYERLIYKERLKSVLYSGLDDERASNARKHATELMGEYKAYSEQNNHAYYPARCSISNKMRQYYRGKAE